MAIRAVTSSSLFSFSPPPPLRFSSFAAFHASSAAQSRSFQTIFDNVMEELQAMRNRRKRVSAISNPNAVYVATFL